MQITITLPRLRTLLLTIAPVLAVTLALALTWGGGATAQENGSLLGPVPEGGAAAGPSVDFNLSVPGVVGDPSLPADDCQTVLDDKKCLIPPGGMFPVFVALDKNVGFAFDAYAIALTYSGGLTRFDIPDECGSGPFPGSTGEIEDVNPGDQSVYLLVCDDTGSPVTPTFSFLAGMSFVCPPYKSKETITISYGTDSFTTTGYNADTLLYDSTIAGPPYAIATELTPGGFLYDETIVINCDNYFPWDIDGDGQVALVGDILAVINHWQELKP